MSFELISLQQYVRSLTLPSDVALTFWLRTSHPVPLPFSTSRNLSTRAGFTSGKRLSLRTTDDGASAAGKGREVKCNLPS